MLLGHQRSTARSLAWSTEQLGTQDPVTWWCRAEHSSTWAEESSLSAGLLGLQGDLVYHGWALPEKEELVFELGQRAFIREWDEKSVLDRLRDSMNPWWGADWLELAYVGAFGRSRPWKAEGTGLSSLSHPEASPLSLAYASTDHSYSSAKGQWLSPLCSWLIPHWREGFTGMHHIRVEPPVIQSTRVK